MSAAGPSEDTRPLTDREYQQVQRLFSDPFSFPLAFKAWLTSFVETADMRLPQASVHTASDTAVLASDAIPKRVFDAKGDLLLGTADDHYARLPLGRNSYVLTADSTKSLGVKWAITAAGAGGPDALAGWMPLTTEIAGVPELVWDADNELIPTYGPF